MSEIRKGNTDEARAYWETVKKASQFFDSLPEWKRNTLLSARDVKDRTDAAAQRAEPPVKSNGGPS